MTCAPSYPASGFLAGDSLALAARLREADGDGLLAACDFLAAAA
jgi:hypothetical protein